jgi:hypothetical protein
MSDKRNIVISAVVAIAVIAGIAFYMYDGGTTATTTAPTQPPASTGSGTAR